MSYIAVDGMEGPAPFLTWQRPDGTDWMQVFRLEASYCLNFPKLARFNVSSDGHDIRLELASTVVSEETIRTLYLNQVLPLAMSRRGELVLHAAAVELGQSALVLLGRSGFGKSTLTTSFARNGYRFLTDDGLQLASADGHYVARSSHASIRLWDDSLEALVPSGLRLDAPAIYTSKSRVFADESLPHCDQPRLVRVAYFLGDGSASSTCISLMRPGEAMVEFVRHSFLLDIEERTAMARHFEQLSDLVGKVAFFRLDYPRDYAQLPTVRSTIIAHALSLPGSAR